MKAWKHVFLSLRAKMWEECSWLKRGLAGAEFGEGFFDEGQVLAAGFHVLCREGPGRIGFLFPV
jgi:hypothetical protein